MNEIAPGDLVYVARDCCGEWIGMTFVVSTIETVTNLRCGCCPAEFRVVICGFAEKEIIWVAPLSWLRKIPPLGELDDIENKEHITA